MIRAPGALLRRRIREQTVSKLILLQILDFCTAFIAASKTWAQVAELRERFGIELLLIDELDALVRSWSRNCCTVSRRPPTAPSGVSRREVFSATFS